MGSLQARKDKGTQITAAAAAQGLERVVGNEVTGIAMGGDNGQQLVEGPSGMVRTLEASQ